MTSLTFGSLCTSGAGPEPAAEGSHCTSALSCPLPPKLLREPLSEYTCMYTYVRMYMHEVSASCNTEEKKRPTASTVHWVCTVSGHISQLEVVSIGSVCVLVSRIEKHCTSFVTVFPWSVPRKRYKGQTHREMSQPTTMCISCCKRLIQNTRPDYICT